MRMDTMTFCCIPVVLTTALSVSTLAFGQGVIRKPYLRLPSNPATAGARSTSDGRAISRNNPPVTAAGFDVVDVLNYGADPAGAHDSAPAFRAALGANRRIVVPSGTYLFSSTQKPPCCAFANPAVLVQSLSNFEIEGHGATIKIDPSIALSSAFQFDKDSRFMVSGLTIRGNRTGLTSNQENVGLTFSSDVDFEVKDIHYSGNFGGNGAAVAGDWLVNGTFQSQQMDAVAHCYDLAYLYHVDLLSTHAKGADTNGNSGAGQPGQTCFSVIVDTPNAAQNNTGISFTDTDDVRVLGIEERNFATGALVETGTHYVFRGNYWHDNPKDVSSPGVGILIRYNRSTSVGAPPSDITIADRFANNGSAVAGYGIYLSGPCPPNNKALANISVIGSTFNNSATAAIGSDSLSHLSDLRVSGNSYSDSAQKLILNGSMKAAASPSEACKSGTPSSRAKAAP